MECIDDRPESEAVPNRDPLDEYCETMLGSLGRSDQRKWGQVYVRALLQMPGRKSIPRMAEHIAEPGGRQSLQQFVNQSPWRPEPVRRLLAREFHEVTPVQAWVIDELVFPKHGSSSAGVRKQFAPSLRRTIRCQLGLALFCVGEEATLPVSWRLVVPSDGGTAHADDGQPSRWDFVFELVDEMASWELPGLPVIVDARLLPDVEDLLAGLQARGLTYYVQVTAGSTRSRRRPRPARRPLVPVVAQPDPSGDLERGVWLTNTPAADRRELGRIAAHRWRARAALRDLQDEHGLQHFEGRSARGWNHHVTLVSLAYGFKVMSDLSEWLHGIC